MAILVRGCVTGETRRLPVTNGREGAPWQILERYLRQGLLVHTVTSEAIDAEQRCGVANIGRPFSPGIIISYRAFECNEIGDTSWKYGTGTTSSRRYRDNKLEKLCTNEREMQRKRPDIQKKLRLRVNALRNAATVGDLARDDPGGACHNLKGDLDGIWAGELSGNWRLLVEPDP